jgi:hypothetical protein
MQYNLDYLEAGIPELENYLLSNELYYPLGSSLPQLTLGGMLLSLTRMGLRAESLRARVESTRGRWRSAWEIKSAREIQARGRLWMDYLAEYRDDPKSGARLYPQNVRYRAMITLLGQEQHESDAFLKSVFTEGNFVWEENSAQNFPRETFWYLFGKLKE